MYYIYICLYTRYMYYLYVLAVHPSSPLIVYDVSLVVVWFLFIPLSDHLIMYCVGRQPDPTQSQDNDMLFTPDEENVVIRFNGPA